MGRPSKFSPEVASIIISNIEAGATLEKSSEAAGISYQTFRNWMIQGQEDVAWIDAHPNAFVLPDQLGYVEFFEAVTRAQAQAHVDATKAVRAAIKGAEAVEEEERTFEETRLRKNEKGEEVPYTYQKTERRVRWSMKEPDARIGIEYLKRRDPQHWSDRLEINATVKMLPPDAAALLPALVEAAEEANMPLSQLFEAIINQLGQSVEISG